jgi:hypothetical protein
MREQHIKKVNLNVAAKISDEHEVKFLNTLMCKFHCLLLTARKRVWRGLWILNDIYCND